MGGVPHVRPSVRGPKKTGDPDFLWKSGGRPTTAFAIWTRKPRRCTGNDAGFFRQEREGKKPQVPPLRYPGFPVQLIGVGELHAAFLTESRIRGLGWYREVGNPGPLRSG
jgi:hypothetical protein